MTFHLNTLLLGPIFIGVWCLVGFIILMIIRQIKQHARLHYDKELRDQVIETVDTFGAYTNTVFRLGLILLIPVFAMIVYFTGWSFESKPIIPGQLEARPTLSEPSVGKNNPSVANDRVREEGRAIQETQVESLNEFRDDFFDEREKE